jgi:hypothetical protein
VRRKRTPPIALNARIAKRTKRKTKTGIKITMISKTEKGTRSNSFPIASLKPAHTVPFIKSAKGVDISLIKCRMRHIRNIGSAILKIKGILFF